MKDKTRQFINERNVFLNKYFNLILSFLLLIFFAFMYVLVIGPKYNAAKTIIKENLVTQKLLYNQQQKKFDTLKVIADIYGRVSAEELLKFNSVLPYRYKQEQLFGEFEEIARNNGWILRSVSLDYPDEDMVSGAPTPVIPVASIDGAFYGSANPNVGQVSISLAIEGVDYQGVKKLLSVLEKNLRLLDVEQISFSGASTVNVQLVTYYYKISN